MKSHPIINLYLTRLKKLEKDLPHVLVSAVALVSLDGTILMQRRRRAAEHGGLWEFPGGKVEEHESATDAAVREIEEELSIRIEPENLLYVSSARCDTEGRTVEIALYCTRTWAGVPQALEAEKLGWFEPGQICDLPMPPLDYPLARALAAHLKALSTP
jgi:ADP-ribose pyrophosphatase